MAEEIVLLVVPLRRRSQRLPEKIYTELGGRPLCVRALEPLVTRYAGRDDVRVVAAIDDEKTGEVLQKHFGSAVEIVMTDPALPSGTDRVFAALLDHRARYPGTPVCGVVNVQGDMPFLDGAGIDPIVAYYLTAPASEVQETPILTLAQDWPDDVAIEEMGQVKVLSDRDRLAIYFSRHPIPYSRVGHKAALNEPEYGTYPPELHIGVYGFTPEVLADFCSHGPVALEKFEGLEQLRAMWLGHRILVVHTEVPTGHSYRGIDTPDDLRWARAFGLKRKTPPKKVVKRLKTKKATKRVAKPAAKKRKSK